ncbi:fungal cellulose binding domain-containing protein [Colletotrichum graminicola]|uniref:lytic cellulose monooxygenase (C4-dehydrogenating) n=1 Tax=Colletotrichum graminicola (strain M1.001 / M2 / FGSC 10212) TaxID=645133 RepID=E3Q215_COLGM|nr:fungal cellulose binding domain-containing protein [Colletotrichum graminicola M1.001]EFQ25116.1 fungal cellulose binding domain-containing protein [Colletotrichum graminicola M1.001]WDK15276.1 fungal cellulose binding domain-containing protein [Colletotrichum graminicola]
MKATFVLSAVLGLASSASAHYTFDKLLVNGQQQGGDNTYIRKHQNSYMPTKFKNTPSGSITPNDADFACNKGATPAAKVMTVKAGDKVALKQAFGGTGMQHPGPSQFYMAPVSNAATAATSGLEWYKVHQSLLCKSGSAEDLRHGLWCSYGEDNVNFLIPDSIPNGQYLVRGEHIGLHGAHVGEAEFYYACAQVEVTGNTATSMPGTGVKIPGVYKQDDAPINFSIWGNSNSYKQGPGPDVIPGGTIRGSPDGSSGDKIARVAGGSTGSSAATQPSASQPAASQPAVSKPAPSTPAASQPTPSKAASSKPACRRRRRRV